LAKKVAAVLTPEKVDRGTDERDNIIVDMKNWANEYEFQKLNADFDKKLDRLSEEYKRRADEILRADRYGLDTRKGRNRFWMWFDRRTGYKLLPKVVSVMFLATVALLGLVFFLVYHDVETILSVDMGAVIVALSLAMLGEVIILISIFGETSGLCSGDTLSNAMLNPGLHHLKGNIWHRDTDQ
jgi:hypothetical protein